MEMTKELYDELSKLDSAYIDDEGREVLNPKPMFLPGHQEPLTIKEQIQRLLRVELSRQAEAQGKETFDQANDFDVPDEDGDPLTPYELNDNDIPIMQEEIKRLEAEIKEIKEGQVIPEEPVNGTETGSEETEESTPT